MSKELPIGLILSIINQFQTDGLVVDIAQAPDKSLVVDLQVAEVSLRGGKTDGILVDEVHVSVSGLSPADLMSAGAKPAGTADPAAPPGSSPLEALLKQIDVRVRHFAVRISRDWINGIIEKGPFLRGTPISDVAIFFNERNKNQLIIRGHAKGLPFETTLLIGLRENRFMVAVDDVRVLGFLPVPAWLRNMATNFINLSAKINRPGVTFKDGVTEVDVLRLIPIPLKMRMLRFETSGRFILVEGGDV